MTINRRSLFAMFIAVPFAKLLPKSQRIGVVNGVPGRLSRVVALPVWRDGAFVNEPSKNWAKHNEECWLSQPSSPEESAWFAEHFSKLWNLESPRYWQDSQLSLF